MEKATLGLLQFSFFLHTNSALYKKEKKKRVEIKLNSFKWKLRRRHKSPFRGPTQSERNGKPFAFGSSVYELGS